MSSSTKPDYDNAYNEARARGYAEGCWLKGYNDGWAKGYQRVAANILIDTLQTRFGALPTSLREGILAADTDSIDAWIDLVLDAPNLQSIFGSAWPRPLLRH